MRHGIIEETCGHSGNIPSRGFHITCVPFHLFHTLNLNFNSNFSKLALDQSCDGTDGAVIRGAGKDHMERSPILFPDSGRFIHSPSRLVKELIGTIHIVGIIYRAANIRVGSSIRYNGVSHRLIAIGQALRNCLFVNGIRQGLSHTQIRQISIKIQNDIADRGAGRGKFSLNSVNSYRLIVVLIAQFSRTID